MPIRNANINSADFNSDGDPEIYLGNAIINANTGSILAKGNYGIGGNKPAGFVANRPVFSHSVAANLLPESGLELAAGNTVYIVEINNPSDSVSNRMIPVIADPPVLDGVTAVADINGNGLLDVIVVRSNEYPDGGGIWVWDPRTRGLIAQAEAGRGGGIPFIGDIDSDCWPEIGVVFQNSLNLYKYNGTIDLDLLYSIPIIEASGITTITMFDLNGDGRQELICRDEQYLYIIDAMTGSFVNAHAATHGTWLEYPLIADIDGNGQADIVIHGSLDDPNTMRVLAFESAGAPWMPARSVWNQTGYHVTNVNDDLTIPRVQQNIATPIPGTEDCPHETCPQVYNNFLVQATMRTQQGCIQYPAPDLAITVTDYHCAPDSITFCMLFHNHSNGMQIDQTVFIACYDINPLLSGNISPLEVTGIHIVLDTMATSDTICITTPLPALPGTMYFTINDDGSQPTPLTFPVTAFMECDYTNNIDSISVGIRPLAVDLGPDLVKCVSEVVSFDAGQDGFVTWLWSDGSIEPVFSTAQPGAHWVEAYDMCGTAYRDTVHIALDSTAIQLGDDVVLCHDETYAISVAIDTGWIRWLPAEIVDCDTCTSVVVTPDSTVTLIVVTGYNACISFDSVVITVMQPVIEAWYDTVCAGTAVVFFDTVLTGSGTFLYTTGDCDTSITITLEFLPVDTALLDIHACSGDTVVVAGIPFWDNGIYDISLTNAHGCDSIVQLVLTVDDMLITEHTTSLCTGDSVWVHDRWIAAPGSYTDTLGTVPCLSILHTTVEMHDSYETVSGHTLCPGDSVFVEGMWLTMGGTYHFSYSSTAGCDSTHLVEITTVPDPPQPQWTIDCETPAVLISLGDTGPWEVLWDNGQTGTTAIYTGGEMATAVLFTDTGCEEMLIVGLPTLPALSGIPTFADTVITAGETLSLDTGLDSAVWQISWQPVHLMSCPACPSTSIMTDGNVAVYVVMEHHTGCVFQAEFMINVRADEASGQIYIPNIFTPNGDGINDTWQIYTSDGDLIFDEVMIFDRWGSLVAGWKQTQYIAWDGTFAGQQLNSAVFVYVVIYRDAGGERRILHGDVVLVR